MTRSPRLLPDLRALARAPLLQVLKTSAAAVAAWLLASWALDVPMPIFAAIAALLVVQPSVNQTVLKGVERSLGVVGGVVIAWLAGLLLGQGAWVVLLVIVAALLVAWALRLGPGSTNQIPISAMLVLALGTGTPGYAVDRILETVMGAAIGLLVNLAIVPPVTVGPGREAVSALLEHCASLMDRLAEAVRTPPAQPELDALLVDARRLRPERERAAQALATGEESLALNPRGGRFRRIQRRDAELLALLTSVSVQVTAMARALHDHAGIGSPAGSAAEREPDALRRSMAVELDRAAHDLRRIGRAVDRESERRGRGGEAEREEPAADTATLPALTAPLTVVAAPPDWMLVGFLLEEIRRVREGIVDFRDGGREDA